MCPDRILTFQGRNDSLVVIESDDSGIIVKLDQVISHSCRTWNGVVKSWFSGCPAANRHRSGGRLRSNGRAKKASKYANWLALEGGSRRAARTSGLPTSSTSPAAL